MSRKPTYEELEQRIRELEKTEDERKHIEAALRQSREELRLFVDSTPDLCFLKDRDGRYLMVNTANAEFFGKAKHEILGKTDFELMPEDAARGCEATDTQVMEGRRKVVGLETVGESTYETWKIPVIRDGEIIGVAGIIRDVTEQKRAEEGLRRSEENYRSIFDSANDALFIHDIETGRIVSVNQKMCEMYGYSKEEIPELSVEDISEGKPPYTQADALKWIQKAVDGDPQLFEWRARDKKGRLFCVEVNLKRAVIGGENRLLAIVRDISERKRAEAEQERLQARLSRAQKMESIGTLAGGIAHNFNNILMGIQGRASLMKLNKDPSHPEYEHLEGIEEYVTNAVQLTRDLLGFARGGKYEIKPTNLNALIKHENEVFGRTKKEIRIHGKYEKGLWSAQVDKGQIRQVLLNLYINAWQAMPAGGELYIQTENVVLDAASARLFEAAPGRYAKISVTDTGTGMDEATREKIFDPFFSTKDTGQGSGLGLASVYGIIKNHGGVITVDSKLREGSTFAIYLPVSEKTVTKEGPKPVREDIQYGNGTILLVDDEDMVIDVGKQMLETLGYQVLIARSGQEALDIYARQNNQIDLVILDMIMPGMGGGEVYDQMKEFNGSVKVLLSSGYSINGQAQEIMDRGCNGFIQKPFTLNSLSVKVGKVLKKTRV
jgi:two-component system, cell cycle sensor histidine kinase and response regulator CckA